jgi:hypothetical protein
MLRLFTSIRTDDDNEYGDMADAMVEAAAKQPWVSPCRVGEGRTSVRNL